MNSENKIEFTVNASMYVVEAELLNFYDDEGGDSIKPFLKKVRSEDNSVKYELSEENIQEYSDSIIIISANLNTAKSNIIVYLYASETWGFQLDNPRKGMIGSQFILARNKSAICIEFCELFINFIQSKNLAIKQTSKIKLEGRYEENQWAILEVINAIKARTYANLEKSILDEWENRRRTIGRPKLVDVKASFRKDVLYPARKLLKQ